MPHDNHMFQYQIGTTIRFCAYSLVSVSAQLCSSPEAINQYRQDPTKYIPAAMIKTICHSPFC